MANKIIQAHLVEGVTELDSSQAPLQLALFDVDGEPVSIPSSSAPVEIEDSEATTVAGLVDDFNDLLAALRDKGVIA